MWWRRMPGCSTALTTRARTPFPRGRLPGRVRIAGFLVGVLIAAGIGALVLWLPQRSNGEPSVNPPPAWQRPSVSASGLAERSGVRLVRVAVTGGGGLLDLRYQVV